MTVLRTRGKRLPWRIWYGRGVPEVLYMGTDSDGLMDLIASRGTIPTGMLTHLCISWERARDSVGYGREPIVLRIDSKHMAENGALFIPREEEEFLTNHGIPLALIERLPGNAVTHRMCMDAESLETLSQGERRIVISTYDDDQRMIHPGDTLLFTDPRSGYEIPRFVTDVAWFPSFKELFEYYPKEMLGYDDDEEASYLDMLEYYSMEEERLNGVVALDVTPFHERTEVPTLNI